MPACVYCVVTTTPEHLFAAGYAACLGGALDFVARRQKKDASKAKIVCAVSIGPREGGRSSHATRGNVPVDFTVVGG